MVSFPRRKPRLEEQLLALTTTGEHWLALIEEALETYLLAGQGQAFEHSVQRAQELERDATDLHRALRSALEAVPGQPAQTELQGAIDATLAMLGAAQSLLVTLRFQRAVLPPGLSEDFARLLDLNLESCRLALRRFHARLAHPSLKLLSAPDLQALEAQSARLARALICGIFEASRAIDPRDGAELLLRDLVLMADLLSERALRLAERLDQLAPRSGR